MLPDIIPAAVPEGRNYVVFLRSLPIAGQPDALTLWVHGDGSGNFLNVWVRDAREQVWQFSFGQIEHNAWRQLTAALDTGLGWPVQRISGSGSFVTNCTNSDECARIFVLNSS